ncbi:MAG: hypothetical protein KAV87_24375, partial [Desulfobacteraceae bacterium]|nr:hypothetical protein [Desulfobacteraceae bacterium]
ESKLTIEGQDTYVHMTEPGGIRSNGLLVIKDSVCVEGSRIDVTRASFEGDVEISNSVITAEAGAPYGQFFIEDTVKIIGNDIHADGDRYMDLDPSVFDGLVENNRIYVRITEGKNQSRGGLFELRGQDDLVSSACGDDEFLCKVDLGTIPVFDLKSWTLEELTLEDGAKVNLTNRFDFQPPYDSGGDEEVLYVRKLVLGEGAVLNTAFNKIYYETLIGDPCEAVKHVPLLGFSLNNIAFDDQIEFVTRIVDNNFDDPNADESADYTRIHVARVEGLAPDPNGMMRMCNLLDLGPDPESSTYGQVVNARAKGLFAKSSEDEILIQFEYLFGSSEPGLELVIYLTDVPEWLDLNDSNHYREVARLPAPPQGRPGSAGSGRFGVFHKYVSRGELDFIRGTRIELELVGPAGACVLINNWDPLVIGCNCYPGDLNFDTGCTVLDFQIAMSYIGSETELLADLNLYCLDFGFCEDGLVDLFDAESWALMASASDTVDICELPLSDSATIWSSAKFTLEDSGATGTLSSGHSEILPANSLLVTGKSGAFTFAENPNNLLKDSLFVFDNEDGHFIEARPLRFDEANGRLVKGPDGEIYQVNHKEGLIRLSDNEPNEPVVSPGTFFIDFKDPRYGLDAEVRIGLSCHDDQWTGRPILDAAFDAAGNIYIVPVVVVPNNADAKAYQAAARLQQVVGPGPQQWEIVKLYDNPPLPNDNRDPDNLREIEVDDAGNVYVANSQHLNEGDALRVFEQDTGMLRNDLNLGYEDSDYYIPGPLAMHISTTAGMLYLASSKNEPDANSTSLYVFSTEDLSLVKTIEIVGMGHIADITEDLTTGTIWVVGFTIDQVPDYSKQLEEQYIEPFYKPYLARIPHPQGVVNPVSAISVSQTADNDITLPLSILWTGSSAEICTRTDIDDSGAVNMVDFALLAARWLDSGCEFSDWCGGVDLNLDGNVTSDDLLLFCNCWLHQDP